MIRIAALNDSSSEEDGGTTEEPITTTKEAKEAEAYTLYNAALSLQRQGEVNKAEDAFRDLLQHGFIREAAKLVEDEVEGAVHPGLQLLYSINKNLATMAFQRGQYREAAQYYIEAVKIDTTEVTVWYKIGTIAMKLYNFPLARLGFEQGLHCNPNHWPCLDHVITLLYTMNDYWNCLFYISQALEKDYLYTKGLVLYKQILKEQPSLKSQAADLFQNCNPSIHQARIEKEEADEYLNEATELRQKRRDLARVPDPVPIKLPKSITSFTWKCLGDCLIELYSMIKSTDPPQSMGLRVDLSCYKNCSQEKITTEHFEKMVLETNDTDKQEEQMDTEQTKESETPLEVSESQAENKVTEVVAPENPVSLVSASRPVVVTAETSNLMDKESSPGGHNVMTPQNVVSSLPIVTSPQATSLNSMTSLSVSSSPLLSSSIVNVSAATATAVSASMALQDHTCAAPMEAEEVARGRGRPPKRKRGSTQWMDDFGVKRRSARVRNTYRQKEECINFQELLYAFLPSSLKHMTKEDIQDVTDVEKAHQSQTQTSSSSTSGEKNIQTDCTKLSDSEDKDVRDFLEKNQENGGTLCLMLHYVLALARKADAAWTNGLNDIFLKVYSRLRKHLDLPDVFCLNQSADYVKTLGKACVMAAEFQLDQWIVNKSRFSMSPGGSPRSPGLTQADLPPHCKDDLWFITGLTCCGDIMGNQWTEHCIRVYWMKARFYMLQGQMEDALYSFHKTQEYLEYAEEHKDPTQILLINCKMDSLISIAEVKKHQESLQRCQSLEETQKLYESGNYTKVIEFLLQTFTQQQTKDSVVTLSTAVPERQAQLLLLQDSLYKLEDHKRGLVWGEVSFNEAVQCYKKASTLSLREQWSTTLSQICQNIIRVLEKNSSALQEMPSTNLIRLAHNLINIIDIIMSVSDAATEMPIGTTLPWILMYRIIKFEEDKIRALQVSQTGSGGDAAEDMPSYLMLLSIAHEYLGRHSWCTKSRGAFLLFYMDVLKEMMHCPSTYKRDLEQSYEQCVYCLYGHPNKKGKARHLLDHNAPQIDLTWDKAMDIFEYFKPKSVPEFDSYKQDTVSGEVEFLLKRIAQLAPEKEKPANMIDAVQEYIEGNTNTAPSLNTDIIITTVSKEMYYLLADYYFKNKEQAKAIRFYMNDICMNPLRLDAWAGMALARMSQLEQKLSSVETESSEAELKMEMPVYRKSIAALRCFKRAVEIDDTNGKLWIEYGSLAYQLHSHASRQLKWQKWFPLNEELLQITTDSRQDMLQIAYNCYKKASECENYENEEEWLQHYMIGKCLEKMKKHPTEYLDHYKSAAENLYEDGATYPKKITYAYSCPPLAVEALEMFYRLHVSVMKVLLSTKNHLDSELEMFKKYIDEAAESPFAKCQEKKYEGRDTSFTDNPSLVFFGLNPGSQTKKSRRGIASQDHTYSKQKSATDSSDQEHSMDALPRGQQTLKSNSVVRTGPQESGIKNMEVVMQISKDSTGNLSAESKDMEVDIASENPKVTDNLVSGTSSLGEDAADKSKASNMMELSAENLDEVVTVTKDSNSGWSASSDGLHSSSSTNSQVTVKKVTEDSKTRMYGDSMSQGSVDDKTSVTKQGSLGFDFKDELSTGTSSSSGLMEDSDGNITVKAKIQNFIVETPLSEDPVAMEADSDSMQSKAGSVKQAMGEKSESSNVDCKESYTGIVEQQDSLTTATVDSKEPNSCDAKQQGSSSTATVGSKEPFAGNAEQEGSLTSSLTTATVGSKESFNGSDEQQGSLTNRVGSKGSYTGNDEQQDGLTTATTGSKESFTCSGEQQGSLTTTAVGSTESFTGNDEHQGNLTTATIGSKGLCTGSDEQQGSSTAVTVDNIENVEKNEEGGETSWLDVDKSTIFPNSQGFQHEQTEIPNIEMPTMSSPEKRDSLDEPRTNSINSCVRGETRSVSAKEVDGQSISESDNSFLSEDSFDSIPSSVSESSVGKSGGDSLSKSGGFLAQFSQFLAKSVAPDDIPLDSPMKSSTVSTDLSSAPGSVINTESAENTTNSLLVNQSFSQENTSKIQNIDQEKSKTNSNGGNGDEEKDGTLIISNTNRENQEGIKGEEQQSNKGDAGTGPDIDTVGMVIDTLINDISQQEQIQKPRSQKSEDSVITCNAEKTNVMSDITKETQRKEQSNIRESEQRNIFETTKAVLDMLIDDVCLKENEACTATMALSEMSSNDKDKKLKEIDIKKDTKEIFDGNKSPKKIIIDDMEVAEDKKGVPVDKDKNTVENENKVTSDKPLNLQKCDEQVQKSDDKAKELSNKCDSQKPDGTKLHKELIEKCMAALRLCLSRFPTHYKSLYRLAYAYLHSPYHKNLQCSHDLLLGHPQWQQNGHMPAQGLFGERKQNNFFQGVWKIPVDEVDRSGSFASHLNRSVKLLLQVLKEQKDVGKLHHLHLQLHRTPDSGKKYLRDGERVAFAKMAHQYCVDAIKARLPDLRKSKDHTRSVKCILEVYKVYNHIQFKMHISQLVEANALLEETFKAVMGDNVKDDEDVLEQAIRFCQQEVQNKARTHHPSGSRSGVDSDKKDGSQSDSSFFTPERPSVQSILAGMKPTTVSPKTPVLSDVFSSLTPEHESGKSSATREQYLHSPVSSNKVSSASTKAQSSGKSYNKTHCFPYGKPSPQNTDVEVKKEEKLSLLKEHLVTNLKSAAPKGPMSVAQSSVTTALKNYKSYKPSGDTPAAPLVTPSTPVMESSEHFFTSKSSEKPSEDSKKDVVVIEISSSDDESEMTSKSMLQKIVSPSQDLQARKITAEQYPQQFKPSQVSSTMSTVPPVLSLTKQVKGTHEKPSQGVEKQKAKIKLTPVRSAFPKHRPKIKITPMKSSTTAQSTVEISSQSDGSDQSSEEKDRTYQPASDESSSDDDHSPVRKKALKPSSRTSLSALSQAELATLLSYSQPKPHQQILDPATGLFVEKQVKSSVTQSRQYRPQNSAQRQNPSPRQIPVQKQNLYQRQNPAIKYNPVQRPPKVQQSPASQELKLSGSGVQVLDPVTGLFVNPNSHTIGFQTSTMPEIPIPNTAAPGHTMDSTAGIVANSDSQESDLVADPEKLFFDVKDWMDFD